MSRMDPYYIRGAGRLPLNCSAYGSLTDPENVYDLDPERPKSIYIFLEAEKIT